MLTSQDIILVPKGAEYRSICRGVARSRGSVPRVVPIAIGSSALGDVLPHETSAPDAPDAPRERKILLMGLAGSLVDRYGIGDTVIYEGCGRETGEYFPCHGEVTATIEEITGYPRVKGLTSDRVIGRSIEKRDLGQRLPYEVVDMEGAIVLGAFLGQKVGIVRVVSDGIAQDLPDLESAIDVNGDLRPLVLAGRMLQRPRAAFHLIRGSLRGLQQLQTLAYQLCQPMR